MQRHKPAHRRVRKPVFTKKPLAAAIGLLSAPALTMVAQPVHAEEQVIEELIVSATRRDQSVQDIPINVAAFGGDDIRRQGIDDLSDLAGWIPGIHIVDQGARASDRIVVRGLNADPLQASEGLDNEGGGIVSTYVGEIPLYVDLKLNDMDRVEVLLGPQGTLYGAGTMGGAVRYIPRKPQFEAREFEVRGDLFSYSEGDDLGTDLGFTFNTGLGERMALRASVDYRDDPGFIDYDFLVREVGVSDADPDLTDPADVSANLTDKSDANDEQTLSGRVALRMQPTEAIDATLTYYFQFQEAGGRTINHRDALGTDRYVSAHRVPEPNDRDNELIALELTADLGFAELTSATGFSSYDEDGQRDQTDLLISLEYSYEAFPSFTSFTAERVEEDAFNQELRLVSTGDGPLSWIVGGFYNDFELENSSREFTPGYDQFAVDNFGGVGLRPDSLEYLSVGKQDLTERALFGEIAYQITPEWQVTLGARWYDYELETEDAVDFPLLNTVFFGAAPDAITLDFEDGGQDDDGTLFKFNTSYQFNPDLLGYFTVSEGYRIGNSNGVAPCPDPLPVNQIACALPNEFQYFPDETTNYEVGIKTRAMSGKLSFNASAYFIEWDEPQIAAATENALIPITINGEGAESQGFELAMNWLISENWSMRATYSYNESELSDPALRLVPTVNPPGFQNTITYEDGESGDRLPGSPEQQGSLFVSYTQNLSNGMLLDFDYGLSAISDVLTRTGKRGGGEALSGYAIHNLAATVSTETWAVTLYANNLTDTYAETAARDTINFAQSVPDINGDLVNVRRYYKNVLPPRSIGLRFTYSFNDLL